jgi:cell division protein FtsI (penicillin-binding protein 3)
MNIKKDILWRVYVSFLFVALLAAAIVFQIVRLQTVKRSELQALADSLTTSYVDIKPIRGNIYAEDGSLLATSIPIYEARMDLKADGLTDDVWKNNIDSLSYCMSNYFKDKTAPEYKHDLSVARKHKERYYLIKRNLTHVDVKALKTFPIFRMGRYKSGLIAVEKSHRILPFKQLSQRTIGFVREDITPVGLEGGYNGYLQGKNGKRLMQKVSGGMVPVNEENELDPKDGEDVVTTIDVNFQDIVENALQKGLVRNGAAHGCAVVMEVGTGKIKAIANLTRKEGSDSGTYTEEYNYALGEAVEPGSTFKLASVMALLDMNKATPQTTVNTTGGETEFYGKTMRDVKEHGNNGVLTLKEAFAYSSNVGISKLAVAAFAEHPSQYTDYIYKLKLNNPLGLSIPGEAVPLVKNPKSKSWSGITLPWMSVGYEIKVSPLQILTLYNSIANNGVMVKPMFVNQVLEVGKVVKQYNTEVINPQVCSPKTLAEVKEMMEEVVQHGTATKLKNDLYTIAGKTGTAQIADEKRGYARKTYLSSFVGFFPADKPMYTVIVVVSNPSKGAYYGAEVSAPVFKEISDKIYARTATTRSYLASFDKQDKKVPLVASINEEHLSTLTHVLPNTIAAPRVEPYSNSWLKTIPGENSIHLSNYSLKKHVVPDLNGMVITDAMYVAENAGLKVRFAGKGKVYKQSLPAGSAAPPGQLIELQLD